jgi:uncharacterized metal-binding protein YceD (DUF177 family)
MTITPEFSRLVPLGRPSRDGTVEAIEATPAECAALARRFGLPGIATLSARFRLTPGEAGTVLAEGWLTAAVTQGCVVTAEPFDDVITESFTLRFVPVAQFDEDAEEDIEAPDEIPYEGRAIDLGETAAEQLALALPPYPRRPGAALAAGVDVVPPEEPSAASGVSPFAALSRFREGG